MSLSFLIPTNAMRVPGISCIGARIYLGKVSSLQAMPEDGWRVVETLEGAALAAIDAVERWAELDFGALPISWQGEHNRLNTCSPAAASCPNIGPVEAARAIPAITHVLSIYSLFERDSPVGVVNAAISKPSAFVTIELQRQQQP